MHSRWYAIRTKSLCEYHAARNLERGGFEVFFPCVLSPRSRPGHIDEPLFPGYLFLRHNPESQGWLSPLRLPGVLGWVRFGDWVPSVPDEVIAELAERVKQINRKGGLWTRFKPGDRVQVVDGKIESVAEVLEEAKSPEDRVRVLLEFMGRSVFAKVPWRSLRPFRDELIPRGRSRPPRRTRGGGRWTRGFGPRAVEAI